MGGPTRRLLLDKAGMVQRDSNNNLNILKTIMAEMNFGGVIETVVTSKEFSLEKAREVFSFQQPIG